MTKSELKFAATPKWYVDYLVIIKGDGGNVVQNGQAVTWKINRRYSGFLALEQKSFRRQPAAPAMKALKNVKLPPGVTLPPEAAQSLKAEEINSIWWTNQTNDFQRVARAEINDEKVSVFVDEGGEAGVGKCRETTTDTWSFNEEITTSNTSILTAKPEKDLVLVAFGFGASESVGAVPVQFTTRVEGNCSQDANENTTSIRGVKISEIRVPSAKGILSGNGVRFSLPKGTVKYDADSFEYTSPAMPIEEEIGGFTNSKGNVGVIVYLKFSKTPPAK